MNSLEVKISGLKCDFCDYRDDMISFNDYHKHINSECPNCGAILLTEEEYNESKAIYKFVKQINTFYNILKWFNPMHYFRIITGKKETLTYYKEDFPKRKV